jgi:dsDNA-specific endonuclease/ATPase MutS2
MSENVSIDEVYRLLEALDEWEEVALHLGLSDQTIQEIRGLSGGNSLRREAMVSKWVQREELEPSWSKLEKAMVSANQESHAAKIRARSLTPASDHDSEKGKEFNTGVW